MSNWPDDELARIAEADDLHIAPFREDGETYGTLTWIWSVRVDDDLYVRADAIDEAYRTKYHDSPYLAPMVGRRARAATMRVVPRNAGA